MGRFSIWLATAVAVATSPIVTWWLLGDLSESATAEDYIYRAPELTRGQQLAIGLGATTLFAVSLCVIAIAVRHRHVRWVEVRPAVPLLVAGAFCGFAWRVVTARVGGANIGGGLILMFGPYFLIAMIACACALAWAARTRHGGK